MTYWFGFLVGFVTGMVLLFGVRGGWLDLHTRLNDLLLERSKQRHPAGKRRPKNVVPLRRVRT